MRPIVMNVSARAVTTTSSATKLEDNDAENADYDDDIVVEFSYPEGYGGEDDNCDDDDEDDEFVQDMISRMTTAMDPHSSSSSSSSMDPPSERGDFASAIGVSNSFPSSIGRGKGMTTTTSGNINGTGSSSSILIGMLDLIPEEEPTIEEDNDQHQQQKESTAVTTVDKNNKRLSLDSTEDADTVQTSSASESPDTPMTAPMSTCSINDDSEDDNDDGDDLSNDSGDLFRAKVASVLADVARKKNEKTNRMKNDKDERLCSVRSSDKVTTSTTNLAKPFPVNRTTTMTTVSTTMTTSHKEIHCDGQHVQQNRNRNRRNRRHERQRQMSPISFFRHLILFRIISTLGFECHSRSYCALDNNGDTSFVQNNETDDDGQACHDDRCEVTNDNRNTNDDDENQNEQQNNYRKNDDEQHENPSNSLEVSSGKAVRVRPGLLLQHPKHSNANDSCSQSTLSLTSKPEEHGQKTTRSSKTSLLTKMMIGLVSRLSRISSPLQKQKRGHRGKRSQLGSFADATRPIDQPSQLTN